MAITDEQLERLMVWAGELGGPARAATEDEILDAVFVHAQEQGMRTLDEFDALVTLEDLPAPEDQAAIVSSWRAGRS